MQESLQFRVSLRKLLIAVLFTVVPISLVALYTVPQSRHNFEKAIGAHFVTLAESAASDVADCVHNGVVEAGLMAADPTVVDAVTAANRSEQARTPSSVVSTAKRVQEKWETEEAVPAARSILSAPVSAHLRRYCESDKRFLRVTVSSRNGITVGATQRPRNYYRANRDFWQSIYGDGRGSTTVTDIGYDPVTKASFIGIGIPIKEPRSGECIGTLEALFDVSSIFPLVERSRLSPSVRALLVRADGTIISAPRFGEAVDYHDGQPLTAPAAGVTSAEFVAAREMKILEDGQAGYMVTRLQQKGASLVALAGTPKRDHENLPWYVVIAQPAREALAPVRRAERLLELMALIGLGAAIFLLVYLSLHRKDEIEEIEEEFHPVTTPKVA